MKEIRDTKEPTMFVVVLMKTYRNADVGTTRDLIEATSEAEAVDTAIREWKKVLPKHWSVRPFFSAPALPGDLS